MSQAASSAKSDNSGDEIITPARLAGFGGETVSPLVWIGAALALGLIAFLVLRKKKRT